MSFGPGTTVFMVFVTILAALVAVFRLLGSSPEEDSETAKRKVFEQANGGKWVEIAQSPYPWKIDLWAEGLKSKGIPAYSSSEHPYITDGAVFALQNKLFVPLDHFKDAKIFIDEWDKQSVPHDNPETS